MTISADEVLDYYDMTYSGNNRGGFEQRIDNRLRRKIKDERFVHEYKSRLDGVIHVNVEGKEVDVRTIDKRYALNLYNWYQRSVDLVGREYFENSVMIQTLKNIIG